MNKQRTFADVNTFQKFKRITRREKFLAEMEQVVPWKKLCHLIEPLTFPGFDGHRKGPDNETNLTGGAFYGTGLLSNLVDEPSCGTPV